VGLHWGYNGATVGLQWGYSGATKRCARSNGWGYGGATLRLQWGYSGATKGWSCKFELWLLVPQATGKAAVLSTCPTFSGPGRARRRQRWRGQDLHDCTSNMLRQLGFRNYWRAPCWKRWARSMWLRGPPRAAQRQDVDDLSRHMAGFALMCLIMFGFHVPNRLANQPRQTKGPLGQPNWGNGGRRSRMLSMCFSTFPLAPVSVISPVGLSKLALCLARLVGQAVGHMKAKHDQTHESEPSHVS
jgi:hypothetical protein